MVGYGLGSEVIERIQVFFSTRSQVLDQPHFLDAGLARPDLARTRSLHSLAPGPFYHGTMTWPGLVPCRGPEVRARVLTRVSSGEVGRRVAGPRSGPASFEELR